MQTTVNTEITTPPRIPEHDLAIAILDEARQSALGFPTGTIATKTARCQIIDDARRWFLDVDRADYGSLRWVCELIDQDPVDVSRRVQAQWGGSMPEITPITQLPIAGQKPCPGLPDRVCHTLIKEHHTLCAACHGANNVAKRKQEPPKPSRHYAVALEELRRCRDELKEQLQKIEDAIETLEGMT